MFKIKENKNFKETKILKLNSSKAYNRLRWKTILNLDELSFYIMEWYNSYYSSKKNKMYNITMSQIKRYEKKVFR